MYSLVASLSETILVLNHHLLHYKRSIIRATTNARSIQM